MKVAYFAYHGVLSASSCNAVCALLLPLLQNGKEFLAGKWEQKPAIFKATPDRLALVHGLCTFPAVINWLKQREKKSGPLEFAVDVNAARYKDGIRETPNGDVSPQFCSTVCRTDARVLPATRLLNEAARYHQQQKFCC